MQAGEAQACCFSRAAILAGILIWVVGSQASALIINRSFSGNPPTNAVGGGDLESVVHAAADSWEKAILDDHTLALDFRWDNLLGGWSAVHLLLQQGGTPNRETQGRIFFDRDGSTKWFLDPSPESNDEYTSFNEFFADLGGGSINTGRRWSDPIGDAMGAVDLYSTALHEIGHAVGLAAANVAFDAETADLDVDVTEPRPFAGTVIPLNPSSVSHIDVSSSLMTKFAFPSQRKRQSALDILAVAQISQFSSINLNPQLPEPATGTLLLISTCLIIMSRKSRARD